MKKEILRLMIIIIDQTFILTTLFLSATAPFLSKTSLDMQQKLFNNLNKKQLLTRTIIHMLLIIFLSYLIYYFASNIEQKRPLDIITALLTFYITIYFFSATAPFVSKDSVAQMKPFNLNKKQLLIRTIKYIFVIIFVLIFFNVILKNYF
jgi:hypothetical protein